MAFPTQFLPVFTMAENEMMNTWEFPCGMIGPVILASGTECVVFPPDFENEGYKEAPISGPNPPIPAGFANAYEWLNAREKREVNENEY